MLNKNIAVSGKVHLLTAVISLLFLGVVYAWSIFRTPLQQLLPNITSTDLSLTFTLSMIFFCLGGLLSSCVDRFLGIRGKILFAMTVIVIGLLLMSTLHTQSSAAALKIHLYYGVLLGCGVGFAYIPIISTTVKKFPNKAGLVSGILTMSYGFGSITIGIFVNKLEQIYGITASFFLLALIFILPLAITACILNLEVKENKNETANKKTFNTTETFNTTTDKSDFSPKQMLTHKFFIGFAIWDILICSVAFLIISNAAQISQYFGAPAVIGLVITLANGIARIIFGKIFDSKGRKAAMLGGSFALFFAGLFFILGLKFNITATGIMALILMGAAFGSTPSISSAVIKQQFGSRYYSTNLSIINLQIAISASLSSIFQNYFKAESAQSFASIYTLILIFGIFAIYVSIILKKFER